MRSVVHVSDYGASYPGNFVASLRALREPCGAAGLRLVLAFSRNVQGRPWLEALRDAGIAVHLLDPGGTLWERLGAVLEVAARERAAILHSHFATYDVAAALAAARRGDTEVVWHAHNALPARRSVQSAAKDAVKLAVLGRRAWLAAVSPAIREEAIRQGFPAQRAHFVRNGVDLRHATAATAGREEQRRRFGLDPAAQVVLAFGWDPWRKGMDVALEAAAAVAARAPLVLLAVGREPLRTFVRERCGGVVPGWVRLVEPQEHAADLFAAADAFLSASREEGFSYALGEALANGLPVIASDIPGVGWIRDVPDVRLFRPGDPRSLAVALDEVLRWTPERREAFAREAREFARGQLSVDAWARRVVALYAVALQDRNRPGAGRGAADPGAADPGAAGLHG